MCNEARDLKQRIILQGIILQGISTEFKLSCFTSSRPIHGWWRYVHIAEHLFVSLRWEMAERSKPSRGLTSLWMTSITSVFRRRRRKLRWAAFSIPDRCGQIAQKHEIFPFHGVGEKKRRRENPPSSGSVHRDTDKIRSTTLPIRSIRFSPLSCHFFFFSGPLSFSFSTLSGNLAKRAWRAKAFVTFFFKSNLRS